MNKLVKRQRPDRGGKASPSEPGGFHQRAQRRPSSRRFGSTEIKKQLQLWVNDATSKPPLRRGKLALLPASSECPCWHLHFTFIMKGVSGDGTGSHYCNHPSIVSLLHSALVGLFSCRRLVEQPQILPLCRGW